jgi:translocator protein
VISIAGIYVINAGLTPLKRPGTVAGEGEGINYTLPPGYVFGIWGVIYLGFLVYAFYGLKRSAQENPYMNRTAHPVALSIVLNLVWVVMVGLEWWVAAYPLQWFMLAIAIYLLKQWDLKKKNLTTLQKALSVPFALYAGWLTVAMIPFTADLLNRTGWDGGPFSRETWGVILYIVATVVVVWAYTVLRQPFYLLPLAWVFWGFVMRFEGVVAQVAMVLGGLLTLYFFIRLFLFYKIRDPYVVEPGI